MKYPQLVSMPSAVSDWLEEQLDARGIDAVVYTRYVLSLLNRDTLDLLCPDQDSIFQQPRSNKEKLPANRGRKRFRRSCHDWWGHVRADVEQLRRSAAVECLMSASDQKCGIESLVDELCEKLKDFQSDCSTETNETNEEKNQEFCKELGPLDLAKRYYAAFPPLSCKPGSSHLIKFIPHVYSSTAPSGSNNKRRVTLSNTRRQQANTQRNRSTSWTAEADHQQHYDSMKSRSGGNKRAAVHHSYRCKKDFSFTRNMEKSVNTLNWDVYLMNRQNAARAGDEGYSTSDTMTGNETEEFCRSESRRNKKENDVMMEEDAHLARLVAKFDRSIEALWNTEETSNTIDDENNVNEYQDLPLDIQELLSSPSDDHLIESHPAVDISNINKSRNPVKKSFIQCGTNITSSIWSDCGVDVGKGELLSGNRSPYDSYCNLYNEALETQRLEQRDLTLGTHFNYLSVGAEVDNETNTLYESLATAVNGSNAISARLDTKFGSATSLHWEMSLPAKKWSEVSDAYGYMGCSPLEPVQTKHVANKTIIESLLTLNHNDEVSCFREVIPKRGSGTGSTLSVPNCAGGQLDDTGSSTLTSVPVESKEEEDLLTSSRTHFRPIRQESGSGGEANSGGGGVAHGQYADGTTFAIKSSLEHVNYKRSDSGTLYLESEFDSSPKKYMEYRMETTGGIGGGGGRCSDTDSESCYSIEREFILKFWVKQNEKCCQTEVVPDENVPSPSSHSPQEVPAKKRVLCDPEEFYFPGDDQLLCDSMMSGGSGEEICDCSCGQGNVTRDKVATNLEPLFNVGLETCILHGSGSSDGGEGSKRPDSTLAATVEISQWNNNWKKCDRCNNNWSSVWLKPDGGIGGAPIGTNNNNTMQSWQHIWSSSEELCRTCLGVPAGSGVQSGRSVEYFKLREELSQDGEQLLSDLSCLQRVYMEQLPASEVSCDLTECLGAVGSITPTRGSCNKERKRRHSSSLRTYAARIVPAAVTRNSWSNAAAACLRGPTIGSEYLVERGPLFMAPSLRPVTL